MRKILRSVRKNPLFRANLLMVGGGTVASAGAYLYHVFMGRMLTISDYGALQSLISLSNVFNVPLTTINTVVVTYIASLLGKDDKPSVAYLYHRLYRAFCWILVIGGGIFLFFQRPILEFLHLSSPVDFIILDIAVFFGLLQILNKATIQGFARFFEFVVVGFIEAYGKLVLGVAAVLLGFGATGAYGAFIGVGAIGFLYTTYVISKIVPHKEKRTPIPFKPFIVKTIPTFFMTVGIMSLFNSDVILVRHYRTAHEAGLYSALSVLGKIIFFGTSPIASVMLPLVSAAAARGENYHKIFFMSILGTAGFSGVVIGAFAIGSAFVLQIFGTQYVDSSRYLVPFGLFISLCSLINVSVLFFFAIGKNVATYALIIAALVQIIGIVLFHQNLGQVVTVSLTATASLMGFLLLYYVYAARETIALRYRTNVRSGNNN